MFEHVLTLVSCLTIGWFLAWCIDHRGRLLCGAGLHRSNYSGNALTFAPRVIRCERCGRRLP